VPANPFAPVTAIRQVPDCPTAMMVIVAPVHPEEETLIPGVPTLIVTPLAVVDVE